MIIIIIVDCLFLADPCQLTYCGDGTCNSATGECMCPEGQEGSHCQYLEGGEAHTHLHIHYAVISKLTPNTIIMQLSNLGSYTLQPSTGQHFNAYTSWH